MGDFYINYSMRGWTYSTNSYYTNYALVSRVARPLFPPPQIKTEKSDLATQTNYTYANNSLVS